MTSTGSRRYHSKVVHHMDDSSFSTAHQTEFIDDRAIHWSNVRRTQCLFYQRFEYIYPGPIYNLKQRLVIIPVDRYGTQQLLAHQFAAHPSPLSIRQTADHFGNRVLELEVSKAERVVSFEIQMLVESEPCDLQRPLVSAAEAQRFLGETFLTMADRHIQMIAQGLMSEATSEHDLAQRISDYVSEIMRYQSGVTTVSTTAAEAFSLKQGLCQDYAHLMLSICRSAGLPARYVSGHLLGEGGSHAWVEVILPTADGFRAFAFDPTNKRQPDLDYITVAVGRDYRDVSPTSGSFTAPYGGQLTVLKRAGLTQVEYFNGDMLQSNMAS
jgi:transglutaminase-like putative cysteine protease